MRFGPEKLEKIATNGFFWLPKFFSFSIVDLGASKIFVANFHLTLGISGLFSKTPVD